MDGNSRDQGGGERRGGGMEVRRIKTRCTFSHTKPTYKAKRARFKKFFHFDSTAKLHKPPLSPTNPRT